MPNTREKLIELFNSYKCEFENCEKCPNLNIPGACSNSVWRGLADHLIANGVTVQPVKVGDTVYTNLAMRGWYFRKNDRPYSARVCFIGLNNSEEMGGGFFNVVYGKHENMMQFRFSDIGKSVFISKEEAEAHLPQPPKGE